MYELKELKLEIATSLFLSPCTVEDLLKRDFLKNFNEYGVLLLLNSLERDGGIYYIKNSIHVKKAWAKKNLKGRDLDFRSEHEKWIDSLTPFARSIFRQQ